MVVYVVQFISLSVLSGANRGGRYVGRKVGR